MPIPKFIFVRHGEAEHNVAFHQVGESAFTDPKHKDAPLTEEGIKQARKTGEVLSEAGYKILDLWSSPLTRCIQTSLEIYEEVNLSELVLHDSLLERQGGGHICNDRKSTADLKKEYAFWNTLFLPTLPSLWIERENETSLQRRMLSFVLLLSDIYKNVAEDSYVLVVGHCDAIFSLTKKSLKNAEYVILSLDEILGASK